MTHSIDITISGVVASQPLVFSTTGDVAFTRFRVASTCKFRSINGEWKNAKTQWFTIKAWSKLAENIVTSVNKGDKVIVYGRLQIETWKTENTNNIDVCIHAISVGQDLCYGKTLGYEKNIFCKNKKDDNYQFEMGNYDNTFSDINASAFAKNSKVEVYDESTSLC